MTRQLPVTLLAIGLAVAVGIGIGSLLADGAGGMQASSPATPGDQPVDNRDLAIQAPQAASPADSRLVELNRLLQDEIRARQALEMAREGGAGAVYLRVFEGNRAALNLYRKMGFRPAPAADDGPERYMEIGGVLCVYRF